MRYLYLSLTLSVTISLAACGSDGNGGDGGGDQPDAGPVTSELTYYQDIKPIIDAKCTQCHYEGGIAPFSLTTFEDVTTHGGLSKLAIESGIMPPWHPDDECADYYADRSLSDEHKAAVIEWIDSGMAEGDETAPGAPVDVEQGSLSRVDLNLTMPEAYAPQATSVDYYDDYRCFVIPWPEQTVKYITGFRAVPGNDAIVHHVIAFLAQPGDVAEYMQKDANEAGPGYECFGGTGGPAREWIGGWAPGDLGDDLPAGLGYEIQPGSAVILQVHYNMLNAMGDTVDPDQTSIELKVDDQVEKVATILPWANPLWLSGDNMHIGANDADATHSFAIDPTFFLGANQLEIYSAGLHMHLLGKSGRLSIERSGGSECLLDIADWDFNWQGSYGFRQPKILNRGDQLRIECHWDNSPENQPTVDGQQMPPRDVAWGEGSTDEMCLGVLLVTQN